MEKLLITGASGIIGTSCIKALMGIYDIHCVYNSRAGIDGVSWHQLNLLDIEKSEQLIRDIKPDKLLHLAWETDYKIYANSYTNIDWIKPTLCLVKAFYELGGKKAVISGTVSEYDTAYGLLTEDVTPTNASNIYGISKNSTNSLLKNYIKANGGKLAWGRIFFAYGGYENTGRVIPYIINKIMAGEPLAINNETRVRDYIHIEDIANAFKLLLENDFAGNVNISTAQPVQLKEIAKEVALQLGRPDLLIFSKEAGRPEPIVIVGNNERLVNMGFELKYDIKDGIKKTIELYREYKED